MQPEVQAAVYQAAKRLSLRFRHLDSADVAQQLCILLATRAHVLADDPSPGLLAYRLNQSDIQDWVNKGLDITQTEVLTDPCIEGTKYS